MRSEPHFSPPDGFEWAVVPDDGWRVGSKRRCRAGAGNGHAPCGAHAKAELNRGRRHNTGRVDCWWAYCAKHLYGRWIEDGRVVGWSLQRKPSPEVRG